eukprot:s302_g8.t1
MTDLVVLQKVDERCQPSEVVCDGTGADGCGVLAAVGLGGGGGVALFGLAFALMAGEAAVRTGKSVEEEAALPGERPRLGGAGEDRTASQADAAARNDEFARLRSEMQEMMRIQVLGMDQLRKDNAEWKNRLAEAEAESPTKRPEPEMPPGLDAHRIDTPPDCQSRLLRSKAKQGIRMTKRRKRARNPRNIKRTIHLIHHLSIDDKMLFKMLKKVMKSKKDDKDDDEEKGSSSNKPKVKEAAKAHAWLGKVWEKDASETELRDPEGFSTLGAKILSGLTNVLEGDFARQTDTFKETEAHAGRLVRGRQLLLHLHNQFVTNALHGSVYDMEDLMNCLMVNQNLTAFIRNWDTILSGIPSPPDNSVLEPLFHRQVAIKGPISRTPTRTPSPGELTRARVSTAREAYLKTGEILPVFNPDLVDRAVETDTNCVMDYIERLYPIDNGNLGWVEFIGQWVDMTVNAEWTLDAQVWFSAEGLALDRHQRNSRCHYSVNFNVGFPTIRCPGDRCRFQMLDGYLHCPRCHRKLFNPSDISHLAELADLAEALQPGSTQGLHYLAPKASINAMPHEHQRQGHEVKKSIAATLKEKCKKMAFTAFDIMSKGMTITSLEEVEMLVLLALTHLTQEPLTFFPRLTTSPAIGTPIGVLLSLSLR